MASNSGFDKTVPSNNSDAGLGDDEFRSVKSFMQAWWEEDHYATDGSANSAGEHKAGSARGFTGTTSQLSNPTEGRVFFTSDDRGIYVGDASGSTWSKYVATDLYPATDSVNTWTETQEFEQGGAADNVVRTRVTGDSGYRFDIRADGQFQWGDGSAGQDVSMYRRAADHLTTDDLFEAKSGLSASGLTFGTDTGLRRDSANVLKTDDQLDVGDLLSASTEGFVEFTNQGAIGSPSENSIGRLGIDDDTSNYRLVIRWGDGTTDVIATGPAS